MFRHMLAGTLFIAALAPAARAQSGDALFAERVKDFGTVPRGPLLKHYFYLTNNTGQPLQIGGVRVSCGCVSASATRSEVPPGESAAIVAQMDTRRFTGAKAVTIYVTLLRPRFEEVSLRVEAFARTDLQIFPDTLSFGQVQRGKPATAKVTVSFYNNPGWQVTGATSESTYVTPEVKQVKADGAEVAYELTARLSPEVPAGKWFTDVWLKTNNPEAERLRVPVTVEVTPAITARPASIAWESVEVGEPAEQRVILTGAEPFRVLRVEGTQGPLTVRGITDEKKAAHVLTFVYVPTSEGQYEGVLKVVTDAPGEAEVAIPARLNAVAQK